MERTAREQRNEFLASIGIDEKGFNRSVKTMIDKESRTAEKKILKKIKGRRAQANWKRRKKLND